MISAFRQIALLLALLTSPAHSAQPHWTDLPEACRQAVVVTTPDWSSSGGELQRFRRGPDGGWLKEGDPWPVRLGKRGLRWGRGLHETPPTGPRKAEGDQTAPVGIFRLGPAFGYAPTPPAGTRLPWREASVQDFWVDDPKSPDYNRWIRLAPGQAKTWTSAEAMRRPDALYEFGIVVHHNLAPAKPGAGSAIFLHVWSGPESTTAGCTSMAREDLLTLLSWLDPAQSPLLLQAPTDAIHELRMR